jgi:hypothetical protein
LAKLTIATLLPDLKAGRLARASGGRSGAAAGFGLDGGGQIEGAPTTPVLPAISAAQLILHAAGRNRAAGKLPLLKRL